MRERGLRADHTTVWRWVQRHAPEIDRRMRPYLKMSGTSYRIGETYVKVGTEWKYLYRAVDSGGNTIEFMLSAKRDVRAAKRFFKKLMRADRRRLPLTIGTDKHASYPEAFAASIKEKVLPLGCKLRRVKYLNNVIEQGHAFIRRRWRAMQCFRSSHAAERTLEGVEARHVMRKGQVKRLGGGDAVGQAKFVESLFSVAAWTLHASRSHSPQTNLCNIYEAGSRVKHAFKHTSPVTARVRIISTKYLDPPRM